MRAAVANGADAVYFGLSRFNARYRAANFTPEELPEVMAYLHGHNVRGYVAFNTPIFSDEMADALGADPSDRLGGRRCGDRAGPWHCRAHLPDVPGAERTWFHADDADRAAGNRIRAEAWRASASSWPAKCPCRTSGPFAARPTCRWKFSSTGALCVSYSGQCLTSEALGGRSANRGQCAQACRLPYELIVDGEKRDLGEKAYLLSPQDLAAYDIIDELTDAGICSFKIEGRLKSAQYVAAATQAYRAAIDASAARRPFVLPRQQELELAQSFSRGFTHGFLDGVNHQQLVHARFPKSRGVRIGTVVGITGRGVVVEFQAADQSTRPRGFASGGELNIGDGLVFDEGHPEQDEQGGRIVSLSPISENRPMTHAPKPQFRNAQSKGPAPRFTSPRPALPRQNAPRRVEIIFDRGAVNLGAVAIGATVWKTDDPAIRRRLEASYARDRVARRVPLSAEVRAVVGQKLSVCVCDDAGHEAIVSWATPLQAAQKFPLTETLFREQFGRLGDTPFELAHARGWSRHARQWSPRACWNDLAARLRNC